METRNFIMEVNTSWETVGEGVRRQIMGYDAQIMTVKVEFATGAIGYAHTHPHVQTTYVASGVFEFRVGTESRVVRAGDALYMEPGIEHGVQCIEGGLLIDTFSPCREDFLK